MIKKLLFCFLFIAISLTMMNCERSNVKKVSKEQIIRLNFCVSTISFHPHLSNVLACTTLIKTLYEGLTRVNLKQDVELAIAEKVEISPCKKIYTFTLKDTKWSNGAKLTSHHFANAWKKALDPKTGRCFQVKKFFIIKNAREIIKGNLSNDKLGLYTPNDKTLVVELENPAPYFLQLIADPVFSPIFSSESYEEPSIFNGPFIVKKYDIEKQLSLVPNKFYWDFDVIKLDEIQISFIKDVKTAFSMYEAGDFNWVGGPFSDIPIENIEKIPNIKHFNTTSPFWVFFNTKSPMLKSAKIRKALSYAIDRSEIVQGVTLLQKELYTIIPSDISTLDEAVCIKNYTIENAQTLFNEGLKELGLKKDDFTFTFNHSQYTDHENLAVYLKYKWEKVFGIKISLKREDWPTFISNMSEGKFSAGGFYLANVYDDPSYLLECFAEGCGYFSTWSNETFKSIIQRSKNTVSEKDRNQYFKEAEELLMDEMPVCPIYNINNLFLCEKELKNLYPPRSSYTDFKWAYFSDSD